MGILEVRELVVTVEGKKILKGVSFSLEKGKIHALMGPNGSGKSTLAFALAGHPDYPVEEGRIFLNSEDITELPPYERARRGLFLGFQYPPEVEGVRLREFLRLAAANCHEPFCEFQKLYLESLAYFRMDELGDRELNVGFSGGEKKRSELLQMRVLRPKVALLDEPDSGVDVDGLRLIAAGIEEAARLGQRCSSSPTTLASSNTSPSPGSSYWTRVASCGKGGQSSRGRSNAQVTRR